MQANERVTLVLKLVYGLVPIVAGLDKFTNVLVEWTRYLPEQATSMLPLSAPSFMAVVGVIEIAAGLLVLSKYTRIGAMVVSAWLVAIAVTLLVGGHWDVAVRDLVMATGAWALSQLAPSPAMEGVAQTARA